MPKKPKTTCDTYTGLKAPTCNEHEGCDRCVRKFLNMRGCQLCPLIASLCTCTDENRPVRAEQVKARAQYIADSMRKSHEVNPFMFHAYPARIARLESV
jgi:hypothetical protein